MPSFTPTARAATARLRAEELESRLAPSVAVRFDYSYDQAGFFNDPARRVALERAAAMITSRLGDDLSAITPSGDNTWQATFHNTVTNTTVTIDNPTVAANEIVVYVAGAPLGTSELGLATTGGYSASGTREWLDTVRSRGQAGALQSPKSDYSTWGGMIAFDSGTNWSFAAGLPKATETDFTSVALHELMHVFGFGLGEPAFVRHVSGDKFTGPAVTAAAGGPVSVAGSPPDHWAPGTTAGGAPSPMQPSLMAGQRRGLTAIDLAVLSDVGWEVVNPAHRVETPAPPTTLAANAAPKAVTPPAGRMAVGTSAGVSIFNAAGGLIDTVDPFGGGSPGGVRVASADVNGDGVPDVIAGTGPGRAATVNIMDGATRTLIASFNPFELNYTGGVNVAGGDFTGDGRAEVVVAPDQSGGPVVAVYDGLYASMGQAYELTRFFGINDPSFRGGVRVAVGDVSGDGLPDLAVAAGSGGGPRVALFDGRSIRGRSDLPSRLAPDFYAFEPTTSAGVNVAVADLTGDGHAEVIVGAGDGGGPRVTAFDGRAMMSGYRSPVADYFAADPSQRGGVRVAALDLNSDSRADVITGSGQDGQLNVYVGHDLAQGQTQSVMLRNVIAGHLPDGIFVG